MNEKKTLLTELSEILEETRLENYEIVEINLTSVSHKTLTAELNATSQEKIFRIAEFRGIPITIDSSIPDDKMWVIRKKRKEEIEE